MHFHLPKAFHGWRELAKEVGIIVLGVLIALSFEQLVQEWRWRIEVRTTRQAFANELAYDALFASERVAVQGCLRDRIKNLSAKLNSAADRWTADPMVIGKARDPIAAGALAMAIPAVYRAPRRPFLSDEWETAKSSGIPDHMSRQDVREFEFLYRGINQLRSFEDEETSLEPQLSFLSFDQTLDPQSRMQLTITLARLDALNSEIALSSEQMLKGLRSMNLKLQMVGRGQVRRFEASERQLFNEDTERLGKCVDTRSRI